MNSIYKQIADEISIVTETVNDAQSDGIIKSIINAKRIFCAGCGRSGFVMRAFSMRLMHLGFTAYFVGEPTQPSIREGDLLIIGSSSGETSSMVTIAKRCKDLKAAVALITSKEKSSLQEIADNYIFIPSRGVNSVQPGGNLFEQSMFIVCDGIAIKIKNLLNIDEAVMDYNHTNLE